MQTVGLKGFHLSFQQARLQTWLQEDQSYRVQYALKIEGVLEIEAFQQALQQVVDRHEILRTTFYRLPGMEIPMQVVNERIRLSCSTISLQGLDEADQMALLDEQFTQLQHQPFDLERGPLMHVVLLRLARQAHVLLLSMHALCADAPTLKLLTSELQQTYVSCLLGEQRPDEDTEELLQYIDVSTWQNELLQEEDAEQQKEFWKKFELARLDSIRLPFEQGERSQHLFAQQTFIPRKLAVPLSAEVQARFQELSMRSNISREAVLLACWQILLWRLTDESPLLGVTCDGRPYEELTTALGLYTCTVPFALSTSLQDHLSFEWVLQQTQRTLEEVSERQLYFSWDSSQSSQFFPVSFTFESWSRESAISAAHSPLNFSVLHHSSYTEPFLLQLHAVQHDSQLQIQFDYQDGVLSADQVHRLACCFQILLQEALEQPQTSIGLLPLLTAAEQEQLRQAWTGPQIDRPFQPLHRLFEACVAQHTQQPAVICGQEQLSYQQLNGQANQLAHLLRRHGVGPNVLVGLCLPRSLQHLVAMLAVLKAGGAYVPLDPDLPPARLERLLEEIAAPVVLTQQSLLPRLGSQASHGFCLETLASQLASESASNLPETNDPQDLAYVIYTSGSTGQPKGVMIRQESVSNYTHALCDLLTIEPGWHFACVSSLAADLGNTVIFSSLASGGCLHLLPYEMVTDGLAFSRYVREHPIDVLKIVPSHLRALLSSEGRDLLPSRFLILGGEALPWSLLEQLRTLQADCQIINHYGPTETTIGTLVNVLGKVGQEQSVISQEQGSSVPIGRPLSNTQAYVLDRHQQWVPLGAVGELYLGGMGLAAGYLHRPEQTQERFITPDGQPSQRLYRTGDLVRARVDGKIEFVGRVDTQVKLRGFRIELGEIEAALRQHPGVREAVVGVYEEPGGEPQLVGYMVAWQLPGPSNDDLRSLLQANLPGYMVPNAFVLLERLPLTSNGKIDRRRLPAPSKQESFQQRDIVAPRTPVEELLVGVWESLLGVAPISVEENFFRLGGHSLLGTQMISRLRGLFGLEVPIGWLFESPTVAELAARLEREHRHLAQVEAPPLVAVSRQQDIPLSFAQQRLWFLDQLEPGSSAYNVPIAVGIDGPLDLPALFSSVREVMRRHEILRTSFPTQDGEPHQVVGPVPECPLVLIDLQALSADSREQVVQQLAQQEAERSFDLACGPLLLIHVLRLQPQSHVSLLTLHHIISDGWSSGILIGELSRLYTAYHEGQPSPLTDLLLQYADYALWQRQWLQGEVLASQMRYWTQQLAGVTPLELPTDRPRLSVQTFHGTQQILVLPSVLSQQIKHMSQQEGVTLFMTLLAAFQVLLSRYSGQSDIAVGTLVANRNRAEIEGLIGFFVNTLVLRSDLSDDPSFRQLLVQVRENALQAYAHQDIPFEQIVEALQPERDRSRSPLFQVLFLQQNAPTFSEEDGIADVTFSPLELEQTTAKFDLTLAIIESQDSLRCVVEYNTDLFESSSIQRMLSHWHVLLQGIVAQPEQAVTRLPLLTEEEQHQQLASWNETDTDEPPYACLHTLFEAQVERRPHAVALVFQEHHLTYGELNRRANQLAHHLQELGIGPERFVGLSMERSLELMVGLLGVLKAGGAYVSLDPSYPQERQSFVLHDARPSVLLTKDQIKAKLSIVDQDIIVRCLDTDWQSIAQAPTTPPTRTSSVSNVAYVIYTSGSTGQPKGVQVTHQGLGNLAWAQMRDFAVHECSHVLQFASTSFDASVSEIMQALLVGGTLYLETRERLLPGPDMLQMLRERAITIMAMPPSALAAIPHGTLPDLEMVVVAGEICPADLVTYWATEHRFLNVYGPTETTIWSTLAVGEVNQQKIGIGYPTDNTQIYLLDPQLQPVPIGVAGEIYIGGIGLARGYLHRPDLTATRFIPNLFSTQPGARMYKTGDKARYRPNGDIEFLGRLDEQVKVRGYRIELGEVEATLNQHPAISECVVVVRDGTEGDKHLVAYVVPSQTSEHLSLTSSDLRTYVQEKLPHYMVPSLFMMLDTLPRMPNKKIDRRALPAPTWKGTTQAESHTAVHSPIIDVVRGAYIEVLNRSDVGLDDNFFELGGHSLLATQLISRIRKALSVALPLRSLFEVPTISGLALLIEQELRHGQSWQASQIVPASREQVLPLSFAQQRLWFLHRLEPENTAYNIPQAVQLSGQLDLMAFHQSITTLIRRHESLRTTFTERDGQPVQSIKPDNSEFSFPLVDLTCLRPQTREEELDKLIDQEAQQLFDLSRGPLLRLCLLRLEPQEHVFMFTMHHIISDGWSTGILINELTVLYNAMVAGQPFPLPALPIQYADYAVWQRQWLQGEVLKEQVRYWTKQLSEAKALELPTDYPRPQIPNHQGARYNFQLSNDLTQTLSQLSRREGVTLFMTLLAAFQTLLYRSSGQEDIVVGTDSANRSRIETEGIIGFFINLLALRVNLADNPPFRDMLQHVREMVLEAYTHQELPFEMIVEHLRLERQGNQTPLINVLFVMQNIPTARAELPDLRVEPLERENISSKFDLALFISEGEDGIQGSANYRRDLFKGDTVETMMRHFEVLLHSIVAHPDMRIKSLEIYTEAEKAQRQKEERDLLKGLKRSKTERMLFTDQR